MQISIAQIITGPLITPDPGKVKKVKIKMTNKKTTSQQNNQPAQPAKKIQKQRQRILKELEEAQQAQAEALERFHRAETRLQKRTAELQRVAAQLLLIQQQLGESATPIPLAMPSSEKETSIGADSSRPSPIHRPAATQHTEEPSQPAQTSTSRAEPDDEFPTVTQHVMQISELQITPENTEDEFPAAAQQTSETPVLSADSSQASQEPATSSAATIQPEQPIKAPSSAPETAIPIQPTSASLQPQEPLSPAQAAEFAREARAVAEAAEQAAREAAERAANAAAHLEQVGSGSRHLLNELQQLQNEAEQADAIAQAAIRTAQEAEAQAQQLTPIQPDDDETALAQPDTPTMIAGAAAAAAAEAEAIAEVSSAHTREARRLAQQADQVLNDAWQAIQSGTWSGEDAEPYLQTLENEATRTHAILADAEAAEEQARRAASTAEVEAEAAEDLAFTTNNQAEQNDNV